MEGSTTTTIGKDGYPVIATTGGGHNGHNDHHDLFSILAGIEATNRNGQAVLNAVTNAENVINKGVYDASVAGIKQTTDGTVSATKAVTDYGMANAETTNRNATAVTKAITDASLSASLSAGELRDNISTIGTANAVSAKDIQIAIINDGCKTRDQASAHFAVLQKDIFDGKYEALKNKCELEARSVAIEAKVDRIKDDVCCCIKEAAAVAAASFAAAENARLRDEVLLSKLNGKGHGND